MIKHEWNGSILTITSDSGTSSCDLLGPKGDDGCRGPQGAHGEGARVTAEQVNEAVEMYIEANGITLYEYGTEDLIAGISPLKTGRLYIVYE